MYFRLVQTILWLIRTCKWMCRCRWTWRWRGWGCAGRGSHPPGLLSRRRLWSLQTEVIEEYNIIYIQCRPYFCHRSKYFYACFKEQKHYQNIIIFDISLLKYNIFRNYFQSINSNFKKYYYFCIKKQLKKMRFSNYWISLNITVFSIYIDIYFSL